MKRLIIIILSLSAFLFASEGNAPHLDGAELSILWVIPFVGILLSIAIFPLIAPHFWHQNFGKISAFWAILFIGPILVSAGFSITLYEILHVGILEYIPFIILILSLFTISGGVQITGSLVGKPIVNTLVLLIGTVLASWMGTTGAAMLLIRPLIRANKDRKNKVHVIVFFIFLVANIGGSLTPLGDPPLFLGFLKGVDFFWTTSAMLKPMLFMAFSLLIIFYIIDTYLYNKEETHPIPVSNTKIGIEGSSNLILLGGVIGAVLLSGFWRPNIVYDIYHVPLKLQDLARDFILIGLTIASWKTTPMKIREANEYTWFPIIEVAKLFSGIFITIIPAIAILKAGEKGSLATIINSVTSEDGPINYMYFWATGILSSFLDNAPTYLVFFNTAAAGAPDNIAPAKFLMGDISQTLLAISAGAAFMGANTYIGNAPNFMVKSMSESSGIEMPSFFGYLFKWSMPILIPLFVLVSFIFF